MDQPTYRVMFRPWPTRPPADRETVRRYLAQELDLFGFRLTYFGQVVPLPRAEPSDLDAQEGE